MKDKMDILFSHLSPYLLINKLILITEALKLFYISRFYRL